MKRALVLMLSLGAGAVLTGCGSDDSGTGSGGSGGSGGASTGGSGGASGGSGGSSSGGSAGSSSGGTAGSSSGGTAGSGTGGGSQGSPCSVDANCGADLVCSCANDGCHDCGDSGGSCEEACLGG